MNPTGKKKLAKKLILGLTFWPMFGPPKFCLWILLLLDVIHCCKLSLYAISRKTDETNLIKCQKTYFRTRFWSLWSKFSPLNYFLQILSLQDVKHCGKLSLYAISRKTNEPNLRTWQKNLVSGLVLSCFGPNLVPKNVACGVYLYQMLYIVASSHCMHFQGNVMNETSESGKKTYSHGLNI